MCETKFFLFWKIWMVLNLTSLITWKTQYSLSQSQHCWWRQWRPLTKSSRWWKGILKKKAKLFKTFKEMYMNSCCRKSPPQARTANFAHHATLLNWWQIWSSRNWDNVLPTLPAVRGFLLGAYQYILTQLSLSQNLKRDNSKGSTHDEDGFFRTSVTAALTKKARILLQESLYGYDIDATMVRLGLMNLMMHGIDEPHIDYQDTLSKSYSEETKYDIVLANPPFTGSIDRGDINENLKLSTTKTELCLLRTSIVCWKRAVPPVWLCLKEYCLARARHSKNYGKL